MRLGVGGLLGLIGGVFAGIGQIGTRTYQAVFGLLQVKGELKAGFDGRVVEEELAKEFRTARIGGGGRAMERREARARAKTGRAEFEGRLSI